jgi:S-adenosylmethionine decarboxylase
MFGPHLILEAYGCPKQNLIDLNLISQVLDAYPKRLGMTKIMPPYVFNWRESDEEDWGISGIVLIAESHITIHTFPEKQFIALDIFSCKDFDTEDAVTYFCDYFQPKCFDKQILLRGKEFPKNKNRAGRILEADRKRILKGSY